MSLESIDLLFGLLLVLLTCVVLKVILRSIRAVLGHPMHEDVLGMELDDEESEEE